MSYLLSTPREEKTSINIYFFQLKSINSKKRKMLLTKNNKHDRF